MPLTLACPACRENNISAQKVLTSNYSVFFSSWTCVNPCCPEKKECGLLWQTVQPRGAELVACHRRCTTGHSSSLRTPAAPVLPLRRAAVGLATRVCLCGISLTKGNETPLCGESSREEKGRDSYRDSAQICSRQ